MKPHPMLQAGLSVGLWKLLKREPCLTPSGKRVVFFQATCACSPNVVRMVSENSLRRTGPGQSRGCGCRRGHRLPDGEAALRLGHRQYKRHCEQHGIPTPTLEEYAKLATVPPLTEIRGRKRRGGGTQPYITPPMLLAGTKAIDAARGYVKASESEAQMSEPIPSVPTWGPKRVAKIKQLIQEIESQGLAVRFLVPE